MKEKALAKINIALDITGVRDDGYHELNSIMIPVSYSDELEIEKADVDSYSCNVPLSFDGKNTVVKAISHIRDKYGIHDCFKVTLTKRIPSQAGLGGGSSDGAAALRILNRMYDLRMSENDILEACLSIGADVLFTYYNRPAVVSGLGDKLEFISLRRTPLVLIAKPNAGVSTKAAYDLLDMNACDHPDIEKIRKRLINGREVASILSNSLEEPSLKLCPAITKLKNRMSELGLKYPLMSGSGSSVFALDYDREKLTNAMEALRKERYFAIVCRMIKE